MLKAHIYHGAQKETNPEKLITFDIVITTYATIRAEIFSKRAPGVRKSPINEIRWFRIVLDEGKDHLKNVRQGLINYSTYYKGAVNTTVTSCMFARSTAEVVLDWHADPK